MKLNEKLKNLHFHTIVIAMGFIVFSLLCWFNLAKEIVVYIKNHPSNEKNGEVFEVAYEPALPDQNILQTITDKTDAITDYIDTVWYNHIYQTAYLSKIDSYITYMLTNEIFSKEVLYGSNNWLF